MNKKIFNIAIFLIIFTFFKVIRADCGNFKIEEDYFADHLIGFYLNSIDINTGDSYVQYFKYRIVNEAYNPSIPASLKADYKLIVNSPELGLFNTEIISGTIDITEMSVDQLVFSNLDINYDSDGVAGANFSLEGSIGDHIQLTDDELMNIQSSILQSGKLPNGTYAFSVSLRCDEQEDYIYDSITKTIEAFEPVFLELVSPGGAIEDTSLTGTLNAMPLFMWNSDYCTQCDYGIRVSEYNSSIHSSLLDAMEDISVLPSNQNLDFYPVDGNQSFSYPTDAFDLIPGNLYAWQIKRDYQTTLGGEENKSEIFVFKVLSFDDLTEDINTDDTYSDLLRELLGYKYEELFGSDGELKDFSMKNNTIILNNQVMPISTLYDIIDKINSGDMQIMEIEVK